MADCNSEHGREFTFASSEIGGVEESCYLLCWDDAFLVILCAGVQVLAPCGAGAYGVHVFLCYHLTSCTSICFSDTYIFISFVNLSPFLYC
jgi:hypothetical protein